MNNNIFDSKYARYYDIIYKDKDYPKECIYIEKLFKKFIGGHIEILDIACGTGNHLLPFINKGYAISGIDLSSAMIEAAKRKIPSGISSKIDLQVASMQNFRMKKRFDVIILMFSAINYLTEYRDLKKTIINIRTHLKPGGVFIFDFWNGFAVLDHYSIRRDKIAREGELSVRRISLTKLDIINHIAHVLFKCSVFQNNKLIDKFEEIHKVRFFFPREIKDILLDTGFKTIMMHPFLTYKNTIADKDWDVTVVAINPR
ncbi:MAG: class I SAM-dependent methyltransferase [Candidatus Omnitrophota bacterium]